MSQKTVRVKCALIAGVMAAAISVLPERAEGQNAQWTFMVYLDADNDLESYGLEDFLEMASVGSNTSVNVVVMFDRTPEDDSSYGDWTETRRGLIAAGDVPGLSWGESIGEVNMGDPDTLVEFVSWGVEHYPAEQYAVVLWNHGNGWYPALERTRSARGVCWDDTNDSDALSMRELREAFAAITATTGPLDLIGFDACLMGMVEVAYDLRDYGAVMVGAEDSEVGQGWPYDSILGALAANPNMVPAQLGTRIVDEYDESVRLIIPAYSTEVWPLSALDLSLMGKVTDGLADLSAALISSYATSPETCAELAANVMSAVDQAVIHARQWPVTPGGHGLAIYFPRSLEDFSWSYNTAVIQFPAATAWDDFLWAFYDSMSASWVREARDATQEYNYDAHVDLYDFCEKLVDKAEDGGVVDAYHPDDPDGDGSSVDDAGGMDSDGDGTPDGLDECPLDPAKTEPGDCGCGEIDTDADGNGIADCLDAIDPYDWDADEQVAGFVETPPENGAVGCGAPGIASMLLLTLGLGFLRFSVTYRPG